MGVTARKADKFSMLRSVQMSAGCQQTITSAAVNVPIGPVPCAGEVVDIIVAQGVAGSAGGTSLSFQIAKNGTNLLSTAGVLTRAIGDAKGLDTRGKMAALSGCTRPVLSTTKATRRVAKGDNLVATITPSGTYSGTKPEVHVTVVIDADL